MDVIMNGSSEESDSEQFFVIRSGSSEIDSDDEVHNPSWDPNTDRLVPAAEADRVLPPPGSEAAESNQETAATSDNKAETVSVQPSSQKNDAAKKNTATVDQSLEEDGQTCTICFEPWTNSSEHRLVSLRCGHLFGRSCISRWLKGQSARCPQCNARARKSEIRNIYAKAVRVLDTTERDKAMQESLREGQLRRKAEMEASQERLKCTLALQECERLKRELMEASRLLQEYRCGSKVVDSLQPSKPKSVFLLEKSMEMAKKGGCRIIDVCDFLGMIIVSQPTTNELFPGYGFRKITALEMKMEEFVLVHQKPIKDMAFHKNDALVLTASLDKTVKITNVLTNIPVQSYTLNTDVWSCAWDTDNSNYFYTGLRTGEVLVFDIRSTSHHVHELPKFGASTPAVALQYLAKSSGTRKSMCGPIVGKLSDWGFYQKLDQVGDYKVLPLPSLGPFTSLSSEPVSGHFLISCRPSAIQPSVTHTVCDMVCDDQGQLVCTQVMAVAGGRSQVQLSRSKLLAHPDDASSLLICAGDEEAQGVLVWDGSSGKRLDRMKTESPVLDLASIKVNHKTHLFSLTDKSLRLYSWNGLK